MWREKKDEKKNCRLRISGSEAELKQPVVDRFGREKVSSLRLTCCRVCAGEKTAKTKSSDLAKARKQRREGEKMEKIKGGASEAVVAEFHSVFRFMLRTALWLTKERGCGTTL